MSTYEVETVFYNNHGGIQTKNMRLVQHKATGSKAYEQSA